MPCMSFHLQERRNSWWYNFRWQCFSRYNFFFLFGSGTILSILTAMLKSSHVYSQSKNQFGSHLKLVGNYFQLFGSGIILQRQQHIIVERARPSEHGRPLMMFSIPRAAEVKCLANLDFIFYRSSIAISCSGSNSRLSTAKMRWWSLHLWHRI